jgi:hypothetical protein
MHTYREETPEERAARFLEELRKEGRLRKRAEVVPSVSDPAPPPAPRVERALVVPQEPLTAAQARRLDLPPPRRRNPVEGKETAGSEDIPPIERTPQTPGVPKDAVPFDLSNRRKEGWQLRARLVARLWELAPDGVVGEDCFRTAAIEFGGTGKRWRTSTRVLARHGYGRFDLRRWKFVLDSKRRPPTSEG